MFESQRIMSDTLKTRKKGWDVKRYAIEKMMLGFDAPAPTPAPTKTPICEYHKYGVNKGKLKVTKNVMTINDCVNERIYTFSTKIPKLRFGQQIAY